MINIYHLRLNRLQQSKFLNTSSLKVILPSGILITMILSAYIATFNHQVVAFSLSLSLTPETSLTSQASSLKKPENSMQHLTFLDSTCELPSTDATTMEVIKLLQILKCDLKPLLVMLKKMLPYYDGAIKLNSLEDIDKLHSDNTGVKAFGGEQVPKSIWTEYAYIDKSIENFYSKSMFGLERKDFCTYPTVERFARLKQLLAGSIVLTHIYDIITIEYHNTCLSEAISKLPQVPYLVREIVDIYISGADKAVPDLNQRSQFLDEQMEAYEDSPFNLQEALAKNGELKEVVKLSLSMPSGVNLVDAFKSKCREFLIEIEERWQSMEMMSQMLSTEGNGIQSFNNYVMRRLIPTKFADICSQLSTTADQ